MSTIDAHNALLRIGILIPLNVTYVIETSYALSMETGNTYADSFLFSPLTLVARLISF
jgi:hypothetical protein